MQHKLPPVPVRILVLLVVIAVIYLGVRFLTDSSDGNLTASGTIEAVTVNISPELAGKVWDVVVAEGQSVQTNDPLLHLDPSLLASQRDVAAAGVESARTALASAQTQYDQTLQAALAAQQTQRALDWRLSAPDEFNQPAWYFEQAEQIASAQTEVDSAKVEVAESLVNLDKVVSDLNNADYIEAERRLADARAAFLVADTVKVQADYAVEGGGLQDAAYDYYDAALDELNAAQARFNALTNTRAEDDVEYARGQVAVAHQRYNAAYARLLSLQTGSQAPAVVAAQNALGQARSALIQAEANLTLLDTQFAKLEIISPMDGVVLTRNVEPGEFVQPGATALTIANLNELTITVYVPEDRLVIKLGQQAVVTVDSYPDETFNAEVIHIADQAEFTPRNVQTVEGRSSTVYAIKLKVSNSEGKLKIGMPADVVFK